MKPALRAPMIVMIIPSRRAQPIAGSSNLCRQNATATAMLMNVCATMATPMMMNRTPLRGVLKLKWLVVPRYAWRAMIANSNTHRDCCGPPDHTARLPPFGDQRKGPGKGEHINRDRYTELRRLQP